MVLKPGRGAGGPSGGAAGRAGAGAGCAGAGDAAQELAELRGEAAQVGALPEDLAAARAAVEGLRPGPPQQARRDPRQLQPGAVGQRGRDVGVQICFLQPAGRGVVGAAPRRPLGGGAWTREAATLRPPAGSFPVPRAPDPVSSPLWAPRPSLPTAPCRSPRSSLGLRALLLGQPLCWTRTQTPAQGGGSRRRGPVRPAGAVPRPPGSCASSIWASSPVNQGH